MKRIKVEQWSEVPIKFTGTVEFPNGSKAWLKEGNLHREDGPAIEHVNGSKKWFKEDKHHREDGPAVEYSDGHKEWWIGDKQFFKTSLQEYIILDEYQGPYNLIWYKLLTKDKVIEYPDIPGLITK